MLKYAKIINEETKQYDVGTGTNTEFYKSIGMVEMEVEQDYNGFWYVKGYAPEKPAPTKDEIRQLRESAYEKEVDTITAHISRLRDEDQTKEIVEEIEELKALRSERVKEIKERYPYPVEETKEEEN